MNDAGKDVGEGIRDEAAVVAEGGKVGADGSASDADAKLAINRLESYVKRLDTTRVDEIGVSNFEAWMIGFVERIADPAVSIEDLESLLQKFRADLPTEYDNSKNARMPFMRTSEARNCLLYELARRRLNGQNPEHLAVIEGVRDAHRLTHLNALRVLGLLPQSGESVEEKN